ncbi:MAG: hypothetical protein DBX55_07040 [Verrucomicrobia bacterium]|nr:MAG: hypothetical protein DBX55_07040 [Verrucomicrobiota bacterium]
MKKRDFTKFRLIKKIKLRHLHAKAAAGRRKRKPPRKIRLRLDILSSAFSPAPAEKTPAARTCLDGSGENYPHEKQISSRTRSNFARKRFGGTFFALRLSRKQPFGGGKNEGKYGCAFARIALEGARKKYPFRNACFMKTNQSAQNKNPKNKPAGKGCHVLRICEVGFYRQNANPVKNDGAHRAFFARPQAVRLRLPRFSFPATGFLAPRARFHKKARAGFPARTLQISPPQTPPHFPIFPGSIFLFRRRKKRWQFELRCA